MKSSIVFGLIILMIFAITVIAEGESEGEFTIIGYEYEYEVLSKEVPVYKNIEVPYEIIRQNCTTSFDSKVANETTNCVEYVIEKVRTEEYIDYYKTEYYDGKRLGVTAGGEYYSGAVNIVGSTLTVWSVPIGDRNFEKYGTCRSFEKQCEEIPLLNEIS